MPRHLLSDPLMACQKQVKKAGGPTVRPPYHETSTSVDLWQHLSLSLSLFQRDVIEIPDMMPWQTRS